MSQLARASDVRRLDFGYFVRPATETGTGFARVEPVYGYLVVHPEVTLLFDSGIGAVDDETERHYQPQRRPLELACREINCAIEDIDLVVNSHLHFDHCGGNPRFGGRPILVQTQELELAQGADYTISDLVDFPLVHYETLNGEAEIADGVVIIPTPGHSDGHQSLLVRTRDGTVLVAGQAMDFLISESSNQTRGCASAYASAVLAWRASQQRGYPIAPWPSWFSRIVEFDPSRVVFAHDGAIFAP